MQLGPLEIEKYLMPSGACPFDDWFNVLPLQDQAMIDTRLDRVSLGNLGKTNSVGDGVFELKFKSGSGFRIYYGRSSKQVILLLCAGNKRTQAKDIARAKNYWNNFLKKE